MEFLIPFQLVPTLSSLAFSRCGRFRPSAPQHSVLVQKHWQLPGFRDKLHLGGGGQVPVCRQPLPFGLAVPTPKFLFTWHLHHRLYHVNKCSVFYFILRRHRPGKEKEDRDRGSHWGKLSCSFVPSSSEIWRCRISEQDMKSISKKGQKKSVSCH